MERLFGMDPGTFRGTYSAFVERVHPDDRDGLQALRADCECLRRPQIITQFRAIRPDGGMRWMEARCRLFYDASGSLQQSVGVAMDITERKPNEIERGRALERLSLAQRAAKFGVWERNPAAQKDWWSDEYYELYALSRDVESSWENWLASIEPEDRERVNREARISFEQGRDVHLEFRVRRPAGLRWFLTVGEALKDRDGKPNRMVGVSIDITGQKRIEEELKQSNQELEQFASIVSHDLQTPLHFVETFSKWLSEQYAGRLDTQADQYLKSIQASIQRMKALITGFWRTPELPAKTEASHSW
jgi:PAS domain S-box-containing protein